jgi:hypothetical protein
LWAKIQEDLQTNIGEIATGAALDTRSRESDGQRPTELHPTELALPSNGDNTLMWVASGLPMIQEQPAALWWCFSAN